MSKNIKIETTPGYQFIHKDWSTRIRTEKPQDLKAGHGTFRAVGWSAADLLAEAMRVKGHIPHVPHPKPPGIVFACDERVEEDPLYVNQMANDWADSVKAVKGRALQKNSPVMSNGVISFPREREDEWLKFRDACLDYLKDKYGDRLKLVVEHLDESHPHIHFYCVPLHGIGKDGKPWSEQFGTVHEGYGESRAVRREHISKVGKNATNEKGKKYTKGASTGVAFVDAMKGFQDDFQEKVGKHFALARIGPRVQKLKHSEAIRQNNVRLAEAELLAAEKARQKADEVLEAAVERARVLEIQKRRAIENAQREAQDELNDFIEASKEEAKRRADQVIKNAEIAAAETKRTIDALVARDESVSLIVYKENIKLKDELSRLKTLLVKTVDALEEMTRRFNTAKSWCRDAVAKLESYKDFSLSHIFSRPKPVVIDEIEKESAGDGKKGSSTFVAPKPRPKSF